MRQRWGVMAVIAVFLLCTASYGFGRASSKVKMVDLNITVGVYDSEMKPLTGKGGVVLVLKQFGGNPWPEEHWSRIAGVPDATGNVTAKTKFPLDPKVTEAMARKARE